MYYSFLKTVLSTVFRRISSLRGSLSSSLASQTINRDGIVVQNISCLRMIRRSTELFFSLGHRPLLWHFIGVAFRQYIEMSSYWTWSGLAPVRTFYYASAFLITLFGSYVVCWDFVS